MVSVANEGGALESPTNVSIENLALDHTYDRYQTVTDVVCHRQALAHRAESRSQVREETQVRRAHRDQVVESVLLVTSLA